MIFEIKSYIRGGILFSLETESLKLCIEAAVKSRADLSGAALSGSDLSGSDLSGSNLSGANLYRSDLSGANLSGAKYGVATFEKGLIQLLGLKWPVLIFDDHIKIGCEFHTIKEWDEFDDNTIKRMEREDALEFWNKNKAVILALAKR